MKYCRIALVPLVSGILLAGVVGCHGPAPADETSAKPGQAALRVTAKKLERKTLRRTTIQPARVDAYEQTPLFAKVDGYVCDVLVDIGDEVTKGQPLAKLQIPEMNEELKQKEALVEQAKAEVNQAKHNIIVKQKASASAKARISEAESAVLRAHGEYERWKAEYERIKSLAKSGSVNQKLVEETLNQSRAAEAAKQEVAARILSAEAAFAESEAQIEKAKADHAAAIARQKVAEAEVERIKALLDYTTIRAPFAGAVTQRNVHTGYFVHPGGKGEPLFVVANMGKVRIVVDVPEVEAALVDVGDPVSIIIPSYSAAPLKVEGEHGPEDLTITRTSWSLQSAARTLQAEIHLDNADKILRPGMYGVVTITSAERAQVLSLPIAALVKRDGRDCCCCIDDNSQVVFKPVIVGLRAGQEVEIVSGVAENDLVIIANPDSFEDGQLVVTEG